MLLFLVTIMYWESSGITIIAKRFEDLPYHVNTIKVDEKKPIKNNI